MSFCYISQFHFAIQSVLVPSAHRFAFPCIAELLHSRLPLVDQRLDVRDGLADCFQGYAFPTGDEPRNDDMRRRTYI